MLRMSDYLVVSTIKSTEPDKLRPVATMFKLQLLLNIEVWEFSRVL